MKAMVQNQLIEYISTQVKLGISRENVRSALVGVGWAVADVEDTFKKMDEANKPAIASSGVAATPVSGKPPRDH